LNVRKATADDVPTLVALFQELDRMQREWRVFTPRPGFYDEVGLKYRKAMGTDQAVVLVAEDEGDIVGMAYGEVRVPSRFSDERALEVSGVVVRSGYRGKGVGRRSSRRPRSSPRTRASAGLSSRPSLRTRARWSSGRRWASDHGSCS